MLQMSKHSATKFPVGHQQVSLCVFAFQNVCLLDHTCGVLLVWFCLLFMGYLFFSFSSLELSLTTLISQQIYLYCVINLPGQIGCFHSKHASGPNHSHCKLKCMKSTLWGSFHSSFIYIMPGTSHHCS